MGVLILASGSSGNAALITSGEDSLLVDAGISATAVRRHLAVFGRSTKTISALLVTHEHSDHARGLDVLQRRDGLGVWATAGTWSALDLRSQKGGELVSGRPRTWGGISVLPVSTSHDAREPVALVFDDGTHRAALCTDTGIFTGLLEHRLADCDLLLLEANHDVDMLRHGPYPWPLKQRIASRLGHLANHQSCEALQRLRTGRLRGVVGLHLSEQNNAPALARDSLGKAVGAAVEVAVVPRSEMAKVILEGEKVRVETIQVPATGRQRTRKEKP